MVIKVGPDGLITRIECRVPPVTDVTSGRTMANMTLQSLSTNPTAAGTWTLVPDRSSIKFSNKTLWGLVPVNGRFTAFSGSGQISADGTVSGRIHIKADSLRTGIGKRDHHLQSADFFDTEKFPEITVEVTGPDIVTLSIRGTTLEVPLETDVIPVDDNTVRITARAEVDRTKWGV
ncbi:MAG: YceI family protein, partial [Candidatus Nanopelagicales bacterium]